MLSGAFFLLFVTEFLLGDASSVSHKRRGQGRIINGTEAMPHYWPWMVSIERDGEYICGGALIFPSWVLTAAHCVHKQIVPNPIRYEIIVGLHDRPKGSPDQRFKVEEIIKYDPYIQIVGRNDIALIKLARPVDKDMRRVKTVRIPPPNDGPPVGTVCILTGWGRTSGGSLWLSDYLQQAELKIVSSDACSLRNEHLFPIVRRSMICAGDTGQGGCHGDSGGPFVCKENGNWYLRGIVSWGDPKCRLYYYTVFTRVSHYLDWILRKVHSEGSCRRPSQR